MNKTTAQPSPKNDGGKVDRVQNCMQLLAPKGLVWERGYRRGRETGGYARLEEVKLVFYGRASLIWSWSLAWMARRLGSVPFGHLLQLQHSAASRREGEG